MASWGFRRGKRLGRNTLNVSKSGASVTTRIGPFSINSRGHVRLRLPGGLYVRLL